MSILKFLGQNAVFWDRIQGIAVARLYSQVKQRGTGKYDEVNMMREVPYGSPVPRLYSQAKERGTGK